MAKVLSVLVIGSLRAVGDGRDLAAAEVLQDHALEQVVDVLDVELQLDLASPVTLPPIARRSRRPS